MITAVFIFLVSAIAATIWYVKTAHRGSLRDRTRDWWIGDEPLDAPPSFLDKEDGL